MNADNRAYSQEENEKRKQIERRKEMLAQFTLDDLMNELASRCNHLLCAASFPEGVVMQSRCFVWRKQNELPDALAGMHMRLGRLMTRQVLEDPTLKPLDNITG